MNDVQEQEVIQITLAQLPDHTRYASSDWIGSLVDLVVTISANEFRGRMNMSLHQQRSRDRDDTSIKNYNATVKRQIIFDPKPRV